MTTGIVTLAESWYRRLLVRADQARALRCAAQLAGGSEVLDVGCGDGLLITEARRAGLLARGIDRPGAPLWPGCDPTWRIAGDIEVVDQPSQSWDVVSLFHVLEHLRDPLNLLSKVHGWLRPRGVLVIQVPNACSLQARLCRSRWSAFDVPRHLVHWTEDTLTRALQQTGYDVLAIRRISWRDNAPCLAASLLPGLDPLVERERLLSGGDVGPPALRALRRLLYLSVVWLFTPFTLFEALIHASASVTVFARKTG
jgi:SAM-dependent methyltransferase